jgi:hypothetical protein
MGLKFNVILLDSDIKTSLFSNRQTISSFTTFSKHSLTTLVYPKQALSTLHLALTLLLNLPSGSGSVTELKN